jgi:hypothetical protein
VIGTGSDSDGDKSVGNMATELSNLVVAYAKQETVDPLKSLGRFVAFGLAGALLIAVGGAVLTLAVVRLLQDETGVHLHGDLSWVPYAGGILVALAGVGWSLSRITRGLR